MNKFIIVVDFEVEDDLEDDIWYLSEYPGDGSFGMIGDKSEALIFNEKQADNILEELAKSQPDSSFTLLEYNTSCLFKEVIGIINSNTDNDGLDDFLSTLADKIRSKAKEAKSFLILNPGVDFKEKDRYKIRDNFTELGFIVQSYPNDCLEINKCLKINW